MRNQAFKRHLLESKCKCSKPQMTLECPFPLEPELLPTLSKLGWKINNSYINQGILYVAKDDLIVIGPFYSSKLNIKCKKVNCFNNLDKLEVDLEVANAERNKENRQK